MCLKVKYSSYKPRSDNYLLMRKINVRNMSIAVSDRICRSNPEETNEPSTQYHERYRAATKSNLSYSPCVYINLIKILEVHSTPFKLLAIP